MTVADLQKRYANVPERDTLIFVSDSQDINPIKEVFGSPASEFDSFFVRAENGEYTEVYGMEGLVPTLDRELGVILPEQ